MPTLAQKVTAAQELIARCLKTYRHPCVLWSGGKDSMVMLHLVRQLAEPALPVVCWREPWHPWKQAFANRIIEEWGLTVWDWHPVGISLCQGRGRIDVLNSYQFGPAGRMILARGINPPDLSEPWLCGRDTFLNRPTAPFLAPWNLGFHGHKSGDCDPTSGQVPLEVDVMDTPGTIAAAFPLRVWSDEDVFSYIEAEGVPYDHDRYERTPDGWETLPYQWRNPDYYPACLRCLDPDAGEWVTCPKLGAQINNIAGSVRWEKPALPYCNLRTEK